MVILTPPPNTSFKCLVPQHFKSNWAGVEPSILSLFRSFHASQLKLCTSYISSPFPYHLPLKTTTPLSAFVTLTLVGPHAGWIIWWLLLNTDILGFLHISVPMNLFKAIYTLVIVRAAFCSSVSRYLCCFHPLSVVNESAGWKVRWSLISIHLK